MKAHFRALFKARTKAHFKASRKARLKARETACFKAWFKARVKAQPKARFKAQFKPCSKACSKATPRAVSGLPSPRQNCGSVPTRHYTLYVVVDSPADCKPTPSRPFASSVILGAAKNLRVLRAGFESDERVSFVYSRAARVWDLGFGACDFPLRAGDVSLEVCRGVRLNVC